jgi:hypothetical protein
VVTAAFASDQTEAAACEGLGRACTAKMNHRGELLLLKQVGGCVWAARKDRRDARFVAKMMARTVAAMTTVRIADGAALSLRRAQLTRLCQRRKPTKKSVQSRRISINGNGTANEMG